jgi:5-methylthioadenosine/S-adenosylhomocysteine deaminase
VAQSADLLLTNAVVLTMDMDFHIFEPGAVAVRGSDIIAVGLEADIKSEVTAEQTIDCAGKVLLPGLINAHTHVPMTLLRGLADDLRLDVWLMGYMMPVEREFVSPDFVQLGTKLACAELIRSGVTCFADMYYFEEYVARTTAEIGLRAVCSQTVLKFPAPDADYYEESLAEAREFIQRWKSHPLIVPSVAPHAPYTTTKEILKATAEIAVEFDVPLHTHLSETALEVENNRIEHGMPVIPYVKKQNLFDAKVLAAHCVHVDEGEILTLFHHGVGIAHNPSSNLKLASGIAPVVSMLDAGLNVGIGTDGPASNNDLDMFEEIRLAAFVAKSSTGDPTALPARKVLEMATRLGAKALHLGDITGSIEPGKRADFILLDLNTLHNSPRFRRDDNAIYAQIVYASHSNDVSDVMVNGKWIMRKHELLTVNPDELIAQTESYARRIDLFLIKREQSILSKLIAIGGAAEVESFEVQVKVRIDDPAEIIQVITSSDIEILHHRHYHEYDTYFAFDDADQGYLRYREDESINPQGEISHVRYRLTMIGPAREYSYPSDVLLSRSRFIAPASHSMRFYREYFQPTKETTIEKDRLRWRILYHGIEFYINIDQVTQPDLGYFLEIKSRTWSRRDAENKANMISDLLQYLGVQNQELVTQDYIQILNDITNNKLA